MSRGVRDGKACLPLRALGRYLLVPYAHGAPQLQLIQESEIVAAGQKVAAKIGR